MPMPPRASRPQKSLRSPPRATRRNDRASRESRGRLRNGVVVYEVPPPLADGTEVTVRPQPSAVQTPTPTDAESTPNVWQKLRSIAGTVKGPPDWAENHDHYI